MYFHPLALVFFASRERFVFDCEERFLLHLTRAFFAFDCEPRFLTISGAVFALTAVFCVWRNTLTVKCDCE